MDPEIVKILMVGDEKCGKTSFLSYDMPFADIITCRAAYYCELIHILVAFERVKTSTRYRYCEI